MKAIELRIGNKVLYNGKVISIAPEALREFYYLEDTHANSKTDKRQYEPIPLTPEILQKAGFVLTDDGISPFWRLALSTTEVISIENDWSFGLNADNETSSQGYAGSGHLCQFLHQLQNLYFALTQTELNIEL